MRLHQLSCFGFSALLLGLGSACSGGQTGDLSGKNDGNGQETGHNASQGCDEHRTELTSFDEETSAGSARELLSYAERRFDAPIDAEPPKHCDLSTTCPNCNTEMQPEHAHYKCAACGYRDSCCF